MDVSVDLRGKPGSPFTVCEEISIDERKTPQRLNCKGELSRYYGSVIL